MAKPPIPDRRASPDLAQGKGTGGALCTRCGMCCMGVIHDAAVLDHDEVEGARVAGLPLQSSEKPVFSLPCPRFDGTLCTIYRERPRSCRRYRCQVLQDLEGGAMSFEEAIRHVDMAKELALRVKAQMPPQMTITEARAISVRPAQATTGPDDDSHARRMHLKLAATALNLYIDAHFRNERDGRILGLTPVTIDKNKDNE